MIESLIIKYNGDLDEYKRLSKYVSYVFGNDIPHTFTSGYDIEQTTRDDDPILGLPWHRATTKEKRANYLNSVIKYKVNYTFGNTTKYPKQYILALYEDSVVEVYDMAAVVIQKHMRGVVTRLNYGVYNPHCEIGKRFLTQRAYQMCS